VKEAMMVTQDGRTKARYDSPREQTRFGASLARKGMLMEKGLATKQEEIDEEVVTRKKRGEKMKRTSKMA
jgi:hypothetical protein